MSPKSVAMSTTSPKSFIGRVAKILENRKLNRKTNITWHQSISEIGPNVVIWLMRYKLLYSYIHCLKLCKYNLRWDFSWNGQISIKE